jgi:hypothetical protein
MQPLQHPVHQRLESIEQRLISLAMSGLNGVNRGDIPYRINPVRFEIENHDPSNQYSVRELHLGGCQPAGSADVCCCDRRDGGCLPARHVYRGSSRHEFDPLVALRFSWSDAAAGHHEQPSVTRSRCGVHRGGRVRLPK